MGVRKITISHKRNDCIGCGSCVLYAPNVWTMDGDDGKSCLRNAKWKGDQFMVSTVDEDEVEDNKKAADACPVGIIRVDGHN